MYLLIEDDDFSTKTFLLFKKDPDIQKALVSNKDFFGEKNFKYFIGYLYNDHKVKPLHVMFPKTSAYVKAYDRQAKWIYFLIKDVYLLRKYNTICDKVSADIKKEFDSKTVYNKSLLKTKIKPCSDKVTDFYNNQIPKADSNHTLIVGVVQKRSVSIYQQKISC